MEKAKSYILGLREKPENVRRQILVGALTFCMVIVGGIWIYGMSTHFTSKQIAEKTKEDVKPFALFGAKLKATYQDLLASAGKADITPAPVVEEQKSVVPNKVIDLIPVER
jgi:hypothetical protein